MSKRGIVLYMHVHQPLRIRDYSVFDTANAHDYYNEHSYDNDRNNERVMRKVADKSYRPMIGLLEKLLHEHSDFRLSLSITGTFIEQAQQWTPDVIDGFKRLVDTGKVEIVAETYYHSLAFFYSRTEFENQVNAHQVFRNTELAYNDELASWADKAGFKGILAEGWDPILQWRSPNHVYRPTGTKNIALLLKNYHLSDDIARYDHVISETSAALLAERILISWGISKSGVVNANT
jgi:alpha-amylase